jgi:hypothetical protein
MTIFLVLQTNRFVPAIRSGSLFFHKDRSIGPHHSAPARIDDGRRGNLMDDRRTDQFMPGWKFRSFVDGGAVRLAVEMDLPDLCWRWPETCRRSLGPLR